MSWPLELGGKFKNYGYSGATAAPVTTATAASANTKGSWTELTSSTGFHAKSVLVNLSQIEQSASALIDVGIGSAGSETVLISNIFGARDGSNAAAPRNYMFPISIPAGTRITARGQSSYAGTNNLKVTVGIFSSAYGQSFGNVRTYGVNTSTSRGTSVDPGAVANTKGSWTQLTASTTTSSRGLVFAAQNTTSYGGFGTPYRWLLDIGIGGAGSETVVVPDIPLSCSLIFGRSSPMSWYVSPVLPVKILSGTRVAARLMCNGTASPARLIDVALYLIS